MKGHTLKEIIQIVRSDPKRYSLAIMKMMQQPLCYVFRAFPYFMQSQMDIHTRSRWFNPKFAKETGAFLPCFEDSGERKLTSLDAFDNTRRDMLTLLLRTLIVKKIEGDFVEVGVYKGNTAKLFHQYAPERKLHLFDTFEGFGEQSERSEKESTGKQVSKGHFSDTSLERVREYISPRSENVLFYPGFFPDTVPESFEQTKFAFVHLDADLYQVTLDGLEYFYPKMSRHGMIVVHDYNAWPGARSAVETFMDGKPELAIPMPDKSGSVLIVKN